MEGDVGKHDRDLSCSMDLALVLVLCLRRTRNEKVRFFFDRVLCVVGLRPSLIKKSRRLLVPEGSAIVAPPRHSSAMTCRHVLAQPP
jgi:hypothetical protein